MEVCLNPHLSTFSKLCSLLGDWQDQDITKNVLVNYRLSAHGSVLVETWTWPEKNIEALTLYHMDGDILMATHYCPIGNQPKLLYIPESETKLKFKIDSITNLPNKSIGHNIEFWMTLDNDNQFTREEVYTEDGELDVMRGIYKRLK